MMMLLSQRHELENGTRARRLNWPSGLLATADEVID
jgi:hypothetical protein